MTGHPLTPDRPARPIPADTEAVAAFSALRQKHLVATGQAGIALNFAEALAGYGRTADAVAALNDALKDNPNSPDLWIALGNALVLHADGAVTPAARLAYDRGEALGRRRPELKAFRALACRRAGGC